MPDTNTGRYVLWSWDANSLHWMEMDSGTKSDMDAGAVRRCNTARRVGDLGAAYLVTPAGKRPRTDVLPMLIEGAVCVTHLPATPDDDTDSGGTVVQLDGITVPAPQPANGTTPSGLAADTIRDAWTTRYYRAGDLTIGDVIHLNDGWHLVSNVFAHERTEHDEFELAQMPPALATQVADAFAARVNRDDTVAVVLSGPDGMWVHACMWWDLIATQAKA